MKKKYDKQFNKCCRNNLTLRIENYGKFRKLGFVLRSNEIKEA